MKLKSGGKEKEPYDSTHMRDIKWRATNGPSQVNEFTDTGNRTVDARGRAMRMKRVKRMMGGD